MFPIVPIGFGLAMPTYGLLHLVAFSLSIFLGVQIMVRDGFHRSEAIHFGIMTLLIAVLGSRLSNLVISAGSGVPALSLIQHSGGSYFCGILPAGIFAHWYLRHFRL